MVRGAGLLGVGSSDGEDGDGRCGWKGRESSATGCGLWLCRLKQAITDGKAEQVVMDVGV